MPLSERSRIMAASELYTNLKDYADTHELSPVDVQNITFNEACQICPNTKFTVAFLKNTKDIISQELQATLDTARVTRIRNLLITDFPAIEFDNGRENDVPYITIWPKGKST